MPAAAPALLAACLGIALFAGMDAAMKGLAIAVGAHSAMLFRTAAGSAMCLGPWLAGPRRLPAAPALRLHLLRGAVIAVMAVSFFWGLARTPIAEAIALTFVAPLLALYLAAVLLGERVPPGAVAGSLCAVAGVGLILVAQAGAASATRSWAGSIAVLFSAVCYAWNLVLQRRQALLAAPLEVALFQNLTVCGLLLLTAPVAGLAVPHGRWGQVALAALLGVVSQQLMSWAYARAPASALVPVEYTAFVWACLFGWAVFGEPLGPAVLAGAGLIVAGCLWALRRRPELERVEVAA